MRFETALRKLKKAGVPTAQLRSFHDTHYLASVRAATFGDPGIITDIENDVTHAFLDENFKGRDIRTILVSWLQGGG